MYIRIIKKILFLTLLLSSLSVTSIAQEIGVCSISTISEAQENYKIGKFEEAISSLNTCIKSSRFNNDQIIKSYHIIILSYLALDFVEPSAYYTKELLKLAPEFTPNLDDPIAFWNLLEHVKNEVKNNFIFSASSKIENVKKTAANIIILDKEEISNRGYADINEVFADLPSFYVNFSYGSNYSNLYQRGVRSSNSDRILFMLDGVSLNNPWSNNSNIAPQIPLSNIEKIEIIYGPASTMYGSNAVSGVVNLITNSQYDNKKLDLNLNTGYGNLNTYFGEFNLKKSFKETSISISTKYYHSDLRDLSDFDEFKYDPSIYESFDYINNMTISGEKAKAFANTYGALITHRNLKVKKDDQGIIESISPSSSGIEFAKKSDKLAMSEGINGSSLAFNNSIELMFLSTSLKFSNLNIGFNIWGSKQGNVTDGTSLYLAGNNAIWEPRNSVFFVNFSKKISRNLTFQNLTTYKSSSINPNSSYTTSTSYANKRLGLLDLTNNTNSSWNTLYYSLKAKEFNTNLRLYYSPSWSFNVYGGIDVLNSSIQDSYKIHSQPQSSIKDINTIDYRNLGIYSQAEFLLSKQLKIVGGVRSDINTIQNDVRDETIFSYRAAIIYSPSNFGIKLISSSAFSLPSIRSLYSVSPFRSINNPKLDTETTQNLEGIIEYSSEEKFDFSISGFYSTYDNVISEAYNKDSLSFQLQNIGKATVFGGMLSTKYKTMKSVIELNYSYQSSTLNDKNSEEIEFGDIPQHQINLIINNKLTNKLNLNTKFHYLSKNNTGAGTSTPFNNHIKFPSTFLIDANLMYRDLLPGLDIQLIGKNILGTDYFAPGKASANGTLRAYGVPQNLGTFMLRINYNLVNND